MRLTDYSTKELKQEIKKRESIQDLIPSRINKPDLHKIGLVLDEYMNNINDRYYDSESEHTIYKTVVETFYGKGIFNLLNQLIEE